jgi:mono/diheme cytochrome c family protein
MRRVTGPSRKAFCAAVLSLLTATLPASATHPVVPGVERLLNGPEAATPDQRLAAGRVLLTELNCVSCHRSNGDAALQRKAKPAPVLDEAGGRVQRSWLANYLAAPHKVKPGTTMPDVFAGLDADQRKEDAEALLHLLASTGQAAEAMGDTSAVQRGQKLFHEIGCVACHDPQGSNAKPIAGSVPLGAIADKYTLPTLTAFLQNPLAVRHGGRMPKFRLTDQQARDIACFFFRDVKIATNLSYAYYEGSWDNLPDFESLKPVTSGLSSGFDVGVRKRNDNFALVFTGFLQIPIDGDFRFFLGSDDGSRLQIDGEDVIVNDGIHPHTVKGDQRRLSKGVHRIRVEYFEKGGEESLTVEVEGPGLPRQPLASIVTVTEEAPEAEAGAEAFVLNEQLVAKGRNVFAARGCANCHQLKRNGQAVEPTTQAKPLAGLTNLDGGCLSDVATAGIPGFGLSDDQKAALKLAISTARTGTRSVSSSKAVLAESMSRFNCYACHVRDQAGGVVEARSTFFNTTMQEMGDEGRLPPHLDGVGDKLTENYLRDTLNNGANDRPYMLTTMPQFGGGNVGHLLTAFRESDLKTEAKIADADLPDSKLKAIGRQLVGEKGLSCIKCHTFGQFKATGIQSIDLQLMSRRLREDWFFRYMANPQAYRPGTRMPAPWPFGQATIRDVLDGNAEKQMRAVWLYLTDGDKAGVPDGLTSGSIILAADKEPRIYRNFIEGVSPRGIAVAYPEKVNLCFDAEELDLALIWENGFIDAAKHWVGRGPGNQRPHGDNVLSLVRGAPFAALDSPEATWPAGKSRDLGYRFGGYRFNAKRQPIFHYSLDDVAITDAIFPASSGDLTAAFDRTLTLTSRENQKLWFRAAAGSKIEQLDGAFVIDDHLRLQISATTANPTVIRQSGGRSELIIPVDVSPNAATIRLRYEW